MLIKKINSIKKFGIYQNFKWNGNTLEFEARNIIYGWNYSGKTTLSRFFNLLKSVSQEQASEIEFKVTTCECNGSTKSHEQAIDELVIYTFNSDYIEHNLHFEKADNPKIQGILFDIGEVSAEKRQLLNDTRLAIAQAKLWLESNHNHIDDFNNFEKIFTNEAKKIKNDIFESQIEFNKGHLKRILDSVNLADLDNYIIQNSEELGQIRANALAKQAMSSVMFQPLPIDLKIILEEINSLLVYTPQRIKDQPILSSSSGMYEWGRYGLQYYLKNPRERLCAFCGKPLDYSRVEELNKFYSNEAANLRSHIKETREKLAEITSNIANHSNGMASPNDIIESVRNSYTLTKADYLDCLNELSDFIKSLAECINKKEDLHLFDKMPKLEFPYALNERFNTLTNNISDCIKSHNDVELI